MNPNTPKPQFDADVIIVGAGPAGATAAFYLSKNGVKVLLLDRQTFPRDKICGDFVSPTSAKELSALGVTDLAGFKEANIIKKAAMYLDGQEIIVSDMPQFEGMAKEGKVIPRKQLDNWILAATKNAGATVVENALVLGFQVKADCVEVNAKTADGNLTFKGQLLIGADGTNSIVANILHGHPPPKANRTVGVRAYFENVAGPQDQADMHFTNESFPGYFWLFPTGEGRANVGVGVLLDTTPKSNDPKELFYQLISGDVGIKNRLKDAKIIGKLETWPINTYDPNLPITADRVMLIGEAAGLVNAINGEGIQYALLSGKWAAQTAQTCIRTGDFTQNPLHSYTAKVEEELAPGFKTSALIVQLIRNRNLNPLWLKTFETMLAHAKVDPQYATVAGGILSGMIMPTEGLTPQFMLSTLQEATLANTIKIVGDTINDPSTLPKNIIKIGETTLQTAANTIENPFAFLQWSLETAAKMAQLATVAPAKIIPQTQESSKK